MSTPEERRLKKAAKRIARRLEAGWVVGPLEGMMVNHDHDQQDKNGHHYHHPLNSVEWLPVSTAPHMQADDYVVGISTDRQAYAIPWWVMKNHHVANLDIDGEVLMIAFCEACSSSCSFDPVVEGQRLTFVWAGHYNGTILLSDAETHSFWSPFTGEALAGSLAGTILPARPLYQSTWEEWSALFPDSVVAGGKNERRDGHGSLQRPGTLEPRFLEEANFIDERLPPNQLVLGVQVGEVDIAYPLAAIHHSGVVLNETIGSEPVVLFSQADTIMALAFSRSVRGRILTFEAPGRGPIRDVETGTKWGWFGDALEGPLKGERLAFVKSAVEEWYVWAAYHPGTAIFSPAGASRS